METMAISKFKATCRAALERVRDTGEPILVTRRGTPVAQVLPPPVEEPKRKVLGCMKGTVKTVGDIIAPATSIEEWEAWSGTERLDEESDSSDGEE